MSGWAIVGLIILVFGVYAGWMMWKIDRDNRPPPRWPGDP